GLGIFPQFVYIALPNDHTYGTKPGKPTPDSMVADNDMATGIIVEAISKSQYWDKTIIFLIEDDPQSWKGDHVEAHRSICLVVSPYVKRKYTSSVHYDIPSIYRTIMMILGIPPMNKNDALAAPMADIFVKGTPEDKPDFTPYEAIPVDIPEELNTESSPMASESAKLDFNRPDGVEGLGYILWRAKKGDAEPPPYAKGIDR
ncbi:MAG: phosphoesterase, partial [Deltaproteobacteria bacterium]|nr:phosphoesterase [Deltaproteobacteria bacterium]